jgi:hypothetical protein
MIDTDGYLFWTFSILMVCELRSRLRSSRSELSLTVAFVVVLLYDYVLTFGMEVSLLSLATISV